MTELDFLLEILLQHEKVPKKTQLAIKERIALIQTRGPMQTLPFMAPTITPPAVRNQAPSMQAAVAQLEQERLEQQKMQTGELSGQHPTVQAAPIATPAPATQAAAKALQDRANAIRAGITADPFSSRPEPGRTSPRKF